MTKNCYDCVFAKEARNLPRTGEQVRCAKAEELFGTNIKGGKRWVDVRKSEKTGKILNSKCGTFEAFQGNEDVAPEVPKETTQCLHCKGEGKVQVKVMAESYLATCSKCNGAGKVEVE